MFALVLLLTILGFGWEATIVWLSDECATSENPKRWRRAAGLEPGNAACWARLGAFEEWDFERGDLRQAAAFYEKAVAANTNSDRHWLALAGVYEKLGELSLARDAYHKAQRDHPISSEVAWRCGSFQLRQGNTSEAGAQFHRALLTNPELTENVVAACWRTKLFTLQEIVELFPPQNRYYFQAVDYFLRLDEIEVALKMWDGLLALGQPISLGQAIPIVNQAISTGRLDIAERVWRQAVEKAEWPRDSDEGSSMVFNGGFEHELANGGFDWREQSVPGVSFAFDSNTVHSGARSMRIAFDGSSNLDFQDLVQYVLVEPRRRYRFTAYLRSQSLSTDSGIRFAVGDVTHPRVPQIVTSGVTGTEPWTRIETEFTIGADTHLLKITLRRAPSSKFDNKLIGIVWVDDVSLVVLDAGGDDVR